MLWPFVETIVVGNVGHAPRQPMGAATKDTNLFWWLKDWKLLQNGYKMYTK